MYMKLLFKIIIATILFVVGTLHVLTYFFSKTHSADLGRTVEMSDTLDDILTSAYLLTMIIDYPVLKLFNIR